MTTYQWKRCDSSGGACVDIPGATGVTYPVVVADETHTIRVAANDGITTALSDPTAVVVPAGGGGFGARSQPIGPFTEFTTAQWYRTTTGGSVSKIRVHDTPDYGVALMGYFSPAPPPPSTGIWTVSDVIGQRIGTIPTHMNGTGEAGLWLGQQINLTRGLGHGTWMGGWMGAQARNCNIFDLICAVLNADGSLGRLPGIGLYLEHSTRTAIIDGLTIISTQNGVNVEWWYADANYAPYVHAELPSAPAGKAGSWSVEIRNFDIDTNAWGMFLDAGTCGFYVHDGIIRGNNGIAHPANLAVPSMPNNIDWGTIDFVGSGTREWIHNHAIGAVHPLHPDFAAVMADSEPLIPDAFRNQPDFWQLVAEQHLAQSV